MQNNPVFEPRNILCPIDFSDLSNLALKYAAIGALQYRSNLVVLHAERVESPRYFFQSSAVRINKELAAEKKEIKDHIAKHVRSILGSTAGELRLEYEVLESHPVEAILKMAEEIPIDLIVMGTRGYSGIKRLVLGSVVKGVLEDSKVALFSVRQKQHDFIDVANADAVPNIQNVLCPCDITDSAELGLRYAVSLSERFHTNLTVLKIHEGEDKPDLDHLDEELCNWSSRSVQGRCTLKTAVLRGHAAQQIIDYAGNERSDLIVMSARHHPFQGGTFFGRTTDLVVRYAPVPVLTVPVIEASA